MDLIRNIGPLLLLGALERADSGKAVTAGVPAEDRLLDRGIADRVTVLGQLSASEIAALWPAATRWELRDHGFSVYCPYCCLNDFTHRRTPYGVELGSSLGRQSVRCTASR